MFTNILNLTPQIIVLQKVWFKTIVSLPLTNIALATKATKICFYWVIENAVLWFLEVMLVLGVASLRLVEQKPN